jgi:elongator complex protein 4
MRGFADNPSLGPHYAPLHGLLTLHSYPTSHALLPPTLRHSTLLGVSQSATNERGGGGAGENNLGFRVKRKGLVVETAHLGIEGGSGERRTAPADVGQALDSTGPGVHDHSHPHTHSTPHIEGIQQTTSSQVQAEGVDAPTPIPATAAKPKKAKKSVRIQFDEGSLDF